MGSCPPGRRWPMICSALNTKGFLFGLISQNTFHSIELCVQHLDSRMLTIISDENERGISVMIHIATLVEYFWEAIL